MLMRGWKGGLGKDLKNDCNAWKRVGGSAVDVGKERRNLL